MPYLETKRVWNFTSSGTGKFMPCGVAQGLTFGITTSSGCTASIQIVHRMGSTGSTSAMSDSNVNWILSTIQCTVADNQTVQFLGPLDYVAPRVKDLTAGSTHLIRVYLTGV